MHTLREIFLGGAYMTFNEYQKEASRTEPNYNNKGDILLNATLGLAGESGELVDLVKKHYFQGHMFDKVEVASELGDILWYIALMCKYLELDLDLIPSYNIAKLKQRYPESFDTERSVDRIKEDVDMNE